MIMAANYLVCAAYFCGMTPSLKGAEALLNCLCDTVAMMLRGRSTEEIRQDWGIVDDLTPTEEAQRRKSVPGFENTDAMKKGVIHFHSYSTLRTSLHSVRSLFFVETNEQDRRSKRDYTTPPSLYHSPHSLLFRMLGTGKNGV